MEEYLKFAKNLALRAGEIMVNYFNEDQKIKIKEDNSFVTIADTTINDLVLKEIKEKFPNHGVLAEEESNFNDEEYVWLCDPLDGTIAYTLNIPISTFAISLVYKGDPIVAVIYDPFQKRLWHAIKEGGAFCNDTKINVNTNTLLSKSIISSSGPTTSLDVNVPEVRFKLQKTAYRLLSFASSQYESMLVASGKMSGVIFPGISPHDMAGVQLIVEEAGGKVTDLYGNKQFYNQQIKGAIVSNSYLHDELLKIVSGSQKSK